MNLISGILFCIFCITYLGKLVILKMKDINASSLGKKGKSKDIHINEIRVLIFTYLFIICWLINIVFKNPKIFLNLNLVNTITVMGIIITTFGVLWFLAATIAMKNSWRVGIDKNAKTALITDGIYKYSRNPAFVGFDLMFLGVLCTFPSLVMMILAISSVISLHLLILQEEKHLKITFKNDYMKYSNKVRRYF